jgi:hypothetical protein
MRSLSLLVLSVLLSGCVSFSSSEAPVPEYLNACLNKEAQCRDICGDRGVQSFSCNATPGEGIHLKCECRRPGASL